jgi:hypothetical protein
MNNDQPLDPWLNENRDLIAALLTENFPGILSDMQVADTLRIRHAYTQADLTIIDWDAALTVDRGGYVEDILYALELVNLQLGEYRAMDQRLDTYLNKIYEDVQRHKFGFFSPYSSTLRTLRSLRVDVTKLNDEVTNITKFFGDWYLARIYLSAYERFHLNRWRTSVGERLKQIDALYTVAHTEISARITLLLEVLIVLFLAIEFVRPFLP